MKDKSIENNPTLVDEYFENFGKFGEEVSPTDLTVEQLAKEIENNQSQQFKEQIKQFNSSLVNLVEQAKTKVLNLDNLMSIEKKKREMIMAPWFPKQGVCMIHAAAGVGKTLFCTNVAYAISSGGHFLTYECPIPRSVLYVDGEMSIHEMQERIELVFKTQGKTNFPDNFKLMNAENFYPLPIPKISDHHGQKFYEQYIEEEKIEVVIFDNISVLSDADENKAHEWSPIVDFFVRLKAKGVSIILVHHAGKNTKEQRGTSKRGDLLTTSISLQEEDSPDSFDKKFKIIYQKARSMRGKEKESLEVTLRDDGIWDHRSLSLSNLDKIADMINRGISQADIAKEMQYSRQYISKVVSQAKEQGLINYKK